MQAPSHPPGVSAPFSKRLTERELFFSVRTCSHNVMTKSIHSRGPTSDDPAFIKAFYKHTHIPYELEEANSTYWLYLISSLREIFSCTQIHLEGAISLIVSQYPKLTQIHFPRKNLHPTSRWWCSIDRVIHKFDQHNCKLWEWAETTISARGEGIAVAMHIRGLTPETQPVRRSRSFIIHLNTI